MGYRVSLYWLSETIELDDTFVGDKYKGKRGLEREDPPVNIKRQNKNIKKQGCQCEFWNSKRICITSPFS